MVLGKGKGISIGIFFCAVIHWAFSEEENENTSN